MSSNITIFIGAWRNHSNGVLTLTLKEREAGVLSAALVIFLGFVAARCWNIIKYVLHQIRARSQFGDGLHHQLQALLRNSDNHSQTSWQTIQLAMAWRSHLGLSSAVRCISLVLSVSLCSLVGWSLGRLFLPLAWTTPGDQVLLQSDMCFNQLGASLTGLTSREFKIWGVFSKNRVESASVYERNCYAGHPSPTECNRLSTPRIPWTASDAPCPFADPSLCWKTNSTPIRMDTGYINSNYHLGINARREQSIEFRQVTTCSPMQSNHYTSNNATNVTDLVWSFYYGPLLESEPTYNYSFRRTTITDGYRIMTWTYDPASQVVQWLPNTTIVDRQDATTSIFFVDSNWVGYFDPVYDPIFATLPPRKGDAFYRPTRFVTILGCIEEYEICNPALPKGSRCSSFTPALGVNRLTQLLRLTQTQAATFTRLVDIMLTGNIGSVAYLLSGQAFLAYKTFQGGIQYGTLPVDQWRAEAGRWFSITLSMIQEALVEFVTGPSEASIREQLLETTDSGLLANCKLQRIRSADGVRNFNLVAVVTVAVVGFIITIISLVIDSAVWRCERWVRDDYQRHQYWLLDGLFQIQRLGYEAAGMRNWHGVQTEIPITEEKCVPGLGQRVVEQLTQSNNKDLNPPAP
ncbi:hypothetical protein FOBRF1_007038 [Fusarium oxysporum]